MSKDCLFLSGVCHRVLTYVKMERLFDNGSGHAKYSLAPAPNADELVQESGQMIR